MGYALAEKRSAPHSRWTRRLVIPEGRDRPYFEDLPKSVKWEPKDNVVFRDLPSPGTNEQLRVLAGEIMNEAMDPNLPLWRFFVIRGYNKGRNICLMERTHVRFECEEINKQHAITDGEGSMRTSFPASLQYQLKKEVDKKRSKSTRQFLEQIARFIQYYLGYIWGVLLTVWWTITVSPYIPPRQNLILTHPVSKKQVAWDDDGLLINDVKILKDALGITFNDVITACVMQAVRRYIDKNDPKGVLDSHFNFGIPVSFRKPGDNRLTNVVLFYTLLAPCYSDSDPSAQSTYPTRSAYAKKISQLMDQQKGMRAGTSVASKLYSNLLTSHRMFPESMMANIMSQTHGGYSNVPGPSRKLISQGPSGEEIVLEKLVAFNPLVHGNPGTLGMVSISYGEKSYFSVLMDRDDSVKGKALYKDGAASEIVKNFKEEFQLLWEECEDEGLIGKRKDE
jgi:hypothetical protein